MITLAVLGIAVGSAILLSTWVEAFRDGPDVLGDGWSLVSNPD